MQVQSLAGRNGLSVRHCHGYGLSQTAADPGSEAPGFKKKKNPNRIFNPYLKKRKTKFSIMRSN